MRIAGISVENLSFMEEVYRGETGRTIELHSRKNQNSRVLQEAYKGFEAFVKDPADYKFNKANEVLETITRELFELSRKEALAGARIISWSEGNAMLPKAKETRLIQEGRDFARTHQVYLLMALAVILPGDITPDRKWLENRTVFIGPEGEVRSPTSKAFLFREWRLLFPAMVKSRSSKPPMETFPP